MINPDYIKMYCIVKDLPADAMYFGVSTKPDKYGCKKWSIMTRKEVKITVNLELITYEFEAICPKCGMIMFNSREM